MFQFKFSSVIFIMEKYVKQFITCFHEITELLLEDMSMFLLQVSFKYTKCNCRMVQWIYIVIYPVLCQFCGQSIS